MPRLERPWSGPPFDAFTLNTSSPHAAGLLAWYPTLASRRTTRLRDARAGAYNMTLNGTYTWQGDGIHGAVVKYDGSSGYAAVTGPNPAAFTVTCWVNFTSLASNNCPVGNFGSGSDKGFWLNVTNTGVYYLWISTDGSAQSSIDSGATVLSTGTWYHLAATYVGGACAIYINGVSVSTGTIGASYHATTTANAFAIGRLGALSSDYAAASIGDVRLYGVAKSPGEIAGMAARGRMWDLYAPVKKRVNYLYVPVAVINDPGVASMPIPFILRPRAVPQARYQFMYYNPQRELRGILTGHGPAAYTTSSDSQGSGFSMELVKTDPKMVRDGGFVLPYRKVDGGIWRYQDTYLVASRPQAAATKGTQFKDIEGDSLTKWLTAENRRVIGLIESTLGSYVTDTPADNALKYFIARAMGAGAGNSGTSRGRDLGFWLNLTTAKDQSLGPTIDYNASLKPLSTVIKDIIGLAELDKNKPVRLFVYVRPRTESPRLTFEVVTVVGQLPSASKPKKKRGAFGAYRGFDSAYPIILGPMFGNVSQIESEHDLREGWNSVVGTWNNKLSTTRITDTRAAAEFPAAFGEVYEDAANSGTEADAQVELRAKLLAGRPRDIHKLTLQDTLFCAFEVHYFLGDIVGVRLDDGRSFEAELTGAQHVLDPGGLPQVTVRAEELLPIVF